MKIFDTIYKYNLWLFGSGTGSLAINNKPYIFFLNKFIKENNIKSVIDVGCGDWQISENIDWNNIKYLGIDVVQSVIDKNVQKHTKPNIRFICKDILDYESLPNADLFIIKDVLQHLSNEKIDNLLNIINKKKFKYILVVSDVSKINLNIDISDGLYRPLDISREPYNIKYLEKKQYTEKLYLIFYIITLIAIIYLTYTKRYKLYYLSLISLILYRIFIFPKKTIFIINKNW